MNSKKTKRALLSSVLALVLCFSMMLGTTFAWFTDSVTSTGNIIKSGTLDVELFYGDTADTITNDASEGAIFDYQYWEPGYTQTKFVKIANVGNLAFKYQLNIIPSINIADDEVNLADVIDVYMIPAANAPADRAALEAMLPSLTSTSLSALMADTDGAAYGIMLPKEGATNVVLDTEDEPLVAVDSTGAPVSEIAYCIVLKMQEEAGNEYQDKSVGEGFKVQLLATQYTYEKDSFDHKYDEDAEYDETPNANVEKMDPDEVAAVTEVKLMNNNYVGTPVSLNTAYVFTAPEDGAAAAESPYKTWHADFVVTFDRDVTAADCVGLAGQYTSWSDDWFGALADADALTALAGNVDWVDVNGVIPAGEPIRLLADIIGVTTNYYELCENVKVFKCGAWAEGELTSDLTMTVELRLYEAPSTGTSSTVESETGVYEVIGTYSYTFEA